MKMRCALTLLVLVLGVLATTSHGEEYRPSFDDPVFEEVTHAVMEIEQPQIEYGKVVAAQIEKPSFQVTVIDRPVFETSTIIGPQILSPEFDKPSQKSVIKPSSTPDRLWAGSYQPAKIQLMQPLSKSTQLVAAHASR